MTKYNFIRVATFITFFLLFFAASVYDPAVYAKMQTLEDDALERVDADGMFIDFNITVSAVANQGIRLDNGDASSDYIDMAFVEIGNGTHLGNVGLKTTMCWDIGSADNQAWLLGGNVYLPTTAAGMGLIANGISYSIAGGTAQILGNLTMNGLYIGQNVIPAVGSSLIPGSTPWILISSSPASGIEFRAEMAAFIHEAKFAWSTSGAANVLTASGIYVFGMVNAPATPHDASDWPATLTGVTKLGGADFPTFNQDGTGNATLVATKVFMNIGANASVSGTSRVRLDIPAMGSIRVRDFNFHGLDMGPIALDSVILYQNTMTLYGL
jgi:hypothetical protein